MLILFWCLNIFSQKNTNITGFIKFENRKIPDAIIELKINKITKFAISNIKGFYKFSNVNIVATDSILVKVICNNYEDFEQLIENKTENITLNVNLSLAKTENLNEVIVVSKDKTTNTASKTIYKINQKDYIKNAKLDEVLTTIPNIYFNEQTETVKVDGKLDGKIFIDGFEAMDKEIKTIDAVDIDKIEIINNPSAKYGVDFLGAIINIITIKKKQDFYKGSVGFTSGLFNNYFAITPEISYKRGRFLIKTLWDFKTNNSIVNYNSSRIDNYVTFFQNNINNSKNNQQFSQTKINIKISDKSNLNLTGFLSGYKFLANAKGSSVLNNMTLDSFSKTGEESNNQWNLSSVYNFKLNENKNLYLKSNYSEFNKNNINNFIFNDINAVFNDIRNKNKEFATSINYEAEELTILSKSTSFYTDLKFINRNFSFSNTNFLINQNIINASLEIDTQWNEKFSTDIAVTLESSNNKSVKSSKNYNLILPTINILYHLKNKYDVKFGYSRKILRPNVGDLNDEILIIYPGVATQGNSNLKSQIRDYYSISMNKTFKTDNLSLKFYNESINNSIENVYRNQGISIIQTLENAAKYNSRGLTFGYKTKLFKKISTNLNAGFDYNSFEDKSILALIKSNCGYTFRGNLNLGTKIFKDKISISFTGRQNGPEYSLLSKRINYPYLDLSIKSNFFKQKLSVNLYAKNLLGDSATGFTDISDYNNFYQKIVARNNSSNLLLTLTYNFGKVFDDKIDDNGINNDDIRK